MDPWLTALLFAAFLLALVLVPAAAGRRRGPTATPDAETDAAPTEARRPTRRERQRERVGRTSTTSTVEVAGVTLRTEADAEASSTVSADVRGPQRVWLEPTGAEDPTRAQALSGDAPARLEAGGMWLVGSELDLMATVDDALLASLERIAALQATLVHDRKRRKLVLRLDAVALDDALLEDVALVVTRLSERAAHAAQRALAHAEATQSPERRARGALAVLFDAADAADAELRERAWALFGGRDAADVTLAGLALEAGPEVALQATRALERWGGVAALRALRTPSPSPDIAAARHAAAAAIVARAGHPESGQLALSEADVRGAVSLADEASESTSR